MIADPLDAHLALVRAVVAALDNGVRVPCFGRSEWISEDVTDRNAAAEACQHCLLLQRCDEYAVAARERHHVWGGRDRGRRSGSAPRAGAA